MILLKNVPSSYKNGVNALRDINLEIDERGVYVAKMNVGKLRHSLIPFIEEI